MKGLLAALWVEREKSDDAQFVETMNGRRDKRLGGVVLDQVLGREVRLSGGWSLVGSFGQSHRG